MTYKLKGIGLALIAMLALGALSASAASANEPAALTVDESPVTITGEDEVVGVKIRGGRSFTCDEVTYHGTASNLATIITLIPNYNKCHSSISGSVLTVTNTGCDYVYTLTGEGNPDKFTATTDLDCGDTGHIVTELWLSKHSHETKLAPTCEYTFGDTHNGVAVNQNLEGIELTNIAAGPETPVNWITADVDVTGIVSTRTAGSALVCGPLLDEAGTLNTRVKLKAENEAEQEVGATISTHAL